MTKLNATNETWLLKLRDHLNKDRYKSGSIAQRMGVSRHFLTYLQARQIPVATVQPADVERYLQQTPWLYPDRHQESPDYS
jgi:hypothetical protein